MTIYSKEMRVLRSEQAKELLPTRIARVICGAIDTTGFIESDPAWAEHVNALCDEVGTLALAYYMDDLSPEARAWLDKGWRESLDASEDKG